MVHAYVVVAKVKVQEAQDLMNGCFVHQPIDVRKWVRVLWVGPIEIHIVNTYPPFTIRFGDHDYIGQQSDIPGFSIKAFQLPPSLLASSPRQDFSSSAQPSAPRCTQRACE